MVAENHTFAGYPDPRVDDAADGGPLRGWAQTSGYNAIASLGSAPTDNVALLCYDRQGWGGGESVFSSHSILARSSVLAVSQFIMTTSQSRRKHPKADTATFASASQVTMGSGCHRLLVRRVLGRMAGLRLKGAI